MKQGKSYSTEQVAKMIGLKGPRIRQLLNEFQKIDSAADRVSDEI